MPHDREPGRRGIRRLLVANRGEIAVRIIRACKELGIESIAVYSDADREALHVQAADRAIRIGPPPAAESYLDIERILDACRKTKADAVHPGYGFLSENEDFAEACEQAELVFLGPSAQAMRLMGDKTSARATVAKAGVPVVPGHNGKDGRGFPTFELALAAARQLEFPIMLKAAAGGGGKGMRLVESEAQLASAYEGARREAMAAFGDDTVYLEKAIVGPRHVEVQIFADEAGRTIHLGERDCSIQRRHQKVIEESPSPAVSPELRAAMGAVAVKAAQACDYRGAGTIEFLLAKDGSFYFLEMNTRLQVEHPVTEMVTGLDLVAWQILVAEGRPLPLDQDQANACRRGAAIECRIYAEDSARFLPAPGSITSLREPGGPYVRIDSGVSAGSEISVFYDPLVAKLITWGEDRHRALGRMRRALNEYRIAGTLRTNLAFHRRMLEHPAFLAGEYDTGFIGREQATLLAPCSFDGEAQDVAIMVAAINAAAVAASKAGAPGAPGARIAEGNSGMKRRGGPNSSGITDEHLGERLDGQISSWRRGVGTWRV
ncbi:MAG: acetyl-CoA carboxylase biotin carboxylase subunit [Pseudomonadota bacterium]